MERFRKRFPVILTDNGGEFENPLALAKTVKGEERTKIFYRDFLASWQKARLEKNHKNIREIISEGQSLESNTQKGMTIRPITSTVQQEPV